MYIGLNVDRCGTCIYFFCMIIIQLSDLFYHNLS